MKIESLAIPDVKLIKPRVFPDARGFFMQTYHYEQYRDAGIDVRFVQDNWSRSTKGVLRGLHYQLKHPQAKLVHAFAPGPVPTDLIIGFIYSVVGLGHHIDQ